MPGAVLKESPATFWIVRPCVRDSSPFLIWPVGLVLLAGAGFALGFALVGAWLVLPFWGIEILALGLALKYVRQHRGDYEKLVRVPGQLTLERHVGHRTERYPLHPYWARLRVLEPPDGGACRLFLGSHGQEIEIGRQLGGEEKKSLARQLIKQLGDQ